MPSLSIILTSYNYAHYLSECIESILNQNYSDYELIIVDDASNDESIKIINQYLSQHSKIKLIQNLRNQGSFEAVQRGIKESKGKYLHICAADDKLLPNFLPKVMEMFTLNPHLKMVCSDFRYFRDNDHHFDEKKLLNVVSSVAFSNKEILNVIKGSKFWVPGASVVFSKNIWEKYGGFDKQLINLSDWYFFQKVALFEGVGYVPQTLAAVRLHGQSFTTRIKQNKKLRRSVYRYLLRILAKNKESRKLFEKAGLLDFIFRELYLRLLLNPLYFSFWPYLYRNFSLKRKASQGTALDS